MTLTMALCANRDAVEAVRLATRLHGAKRAWHLAAKLLGISERTARALASGETSGATICPIRAAEARLSFRRQRAEQIRAELRELGEQDHVAHVEGGGAHPGRAGGSADGRGGVVLRPCPTLAAVTA